jgi:hypothetical protein
MNRTEYVRVLDADVRYRVCFVEDHGLIREFVVQLEIVVEDRWTPVIRYDTAHGFAHCDRYEPDGTVKRHEPLPAADFNQALTWATRRIRTDWEELVHSFRKQRP